MSKTLVVFYSRTGTTKKVAEMITSKLNADTEEIISIKNRSGIWGYLVSGREAMKEIPAEIQPTQKNPAEYDTVIVGTPIWGGKMSSPVRAYLINHKNEFKKIALFCTAGGSTGEKALKTMKDICSKETAAFLVLKTKEVVSGNFEQKTNKFINQLNT